MAVSGKSIIHYTRTLDNLKSILSGSGLRLKYCLENIEFDGKQDSFVAFPMVCFCDLPLTLAKDHITNYGGYGIGLSKTWARANKLNPVLYMEYGSLITRSIKVLTSKLIQREKAEVEELKNSKQERPSEKLSEAKQASPERVALVRILAFCKRHVGPLFRGGELVDENYVFYDEREWRFVPDSTVLPKGHFMAVPGRIYEQDKQAINEAIASTMLNFTHEDISYILVESQEDVLPIIKCLHDRYADELPITKVQEICTRIVTKQQIINDF